MLLNNEFPVNIAKNDFKFNLIETMKGVSHQYLFVDKYLHDVNIERGRAVLVLSEDVLWIRNSP